MGKKEKAHRQKVAKRNEKIKSEKTRMQRVFNTILQERMEQMKKDDLKVQVGDTPVNFDVVQPK